MILGLLLAFLPLAATLEAESECWRISVREYRDRAAAAWIGQMVGVEWGMPTELRARGRVLAENEVPKWNPEWVNRAYGNDDLFVEMTFLRTLETRGLGVTSRAAGIDFANTEYGLCGANYVGRNNLRTGIAPPDAGHPKFNRCADDLDYQIEADFAGIVSPGMPTEVVRLAGVFGPLVGYGDAVYGGAFVGAMYAAAFFQSEPEKIVREALKAIPQDCLYAEMVRDVLAWYAESPKDWTACWKKVNAKYASEEVRRNGLNLNPGSTVISNGACILIGLLYGGGDPDRTMVVAMRCGWDSDCNPSNAAGVLFASRGMRGVNEKYVSALDRKKRFNCSNYDFDALLDVCERLAREGVKRIGGRVEKDAKGEEWLVIPQRKVKMVAAASSHRPAPPTNARYTAEERSQIRFRGFEGPQKAIAAAVAANQQLVTIPQGIFELKEPTDGGAYIRLKGVKNLRIVGSWAKYICPSRRPFLEIVDCDNIIVEAMKIAYPSEKEVDASFPVRVIRSTNVKFDDVTCGGKAVKSSMTEAVQAAWKPTERWRGFNIIDRIYNDGPNYYFHEDDFRLMRELGFNFARVTINYRHWIKDGDWNQIDETKFAEYDKVVGFGRKYGIHIQFCFHRAPGWCVASWPVEAKNLFKDEEALEVCVKHWRYFAERYREVPPEALSFNLLNEPPGGDPVNDTRVSKRLIAAIREVSPERFIVADGSGLSRSPNPELFGMGVGQATRGYLPTDVTLYLAPWGAPNAPEPEWPYDPTAPIGNFMGPSKQLTYGKHPLVLEYLPAGTLAFRFGIINGPVMFEVKADGLIVAEWELKPTKDDPKWTGYSFDERWKVEKATYTGTKGVKLPEGASRVEVSISKGDWGCLRKVAFRPDGKDAKSAVFPIYVEFGSHINFTQQFDAKKGGFVAAAEPGDLDYKPRYADGGREYLYRHVFRYWDGPLAKGEFGMIGEFACWKKTPHKVALAIIEDYLKLAKERNMGWAMWQFRGEHGVVNSGREDVEYEAIEGFPEYKLDRKMYELLKRY